MLILDKEPLYKGNNTPKVKDPVVYITEENEGFLFSIFNRMIESYWRYI